METKAQAQAKTQERERILLLTRSIWIDLTLLFSFLILTSVVITKIGEEKEAKFLFWSSARSIIDRKKNKGEIFVRNTMFTYHFPIDHFSFLDLHCPWRSIWFIYSSGQNSSRIDQHGQRNSSRNKRANKRMKKVDACDLIRARCVCCVCRTSEVCQRCVDTE